MTQNDYKKIIPSEDDREQFDQKLAAEKHQQAKKDLSKTLVYRHIALLTISYTGFLRLLAGNKILQIPLLFSHLFEVLVSSTPLMVIQFYNNKNLDKFQIPLDLLNLIFFILSLVDLIAQMCFSHIWKPDSEYTLISKTKVGLAKAKTGEADDSDDIDSEVISSEEESDENDESANKIVQVGKRGFTKKKIQYYKSKFKNDETRFMKKEEVLNHDFGFMWFISLILTGAFVVLGFNIFSLENCGVNFYQQDSFCFDCLSPLGNDCKACSQFNICDDCKKGFYLGDVQIADIT